jgi:hypothetical protein
LATYTGASSRWDKGAKVELAVFALPDGTRLVVDVNTASLGSPMDRGALGGSAEIFGCAIAIVAGYTERTGLRPGAVPSDWP